MADVPVSKAGVSSAMNDTTRELGGALGVAVLGSMMNRAFPGQLNQLAIMRLLTEKVYETISIGIEGANRIGPECSGDRKDKGHQRLMIGRLVREISCPLSCALPPLT